MSGCASMRMRCAIKLYPWGLVLFALVFTQFGFSSYAIILKAFAQGEKTDPLVFSALRDMLALPLLMVAAILKEGRHSPKNRYQWLLFGLLGLFGMLGNQLGFILGLYYTTPSIAAIMQPLIPVVTYLMSIACGMEAMPVLRETVGQARVLGTIASVCGAIVIVLAHRAPSAETVQTQTSFMLFGLCCLLTNIACMATYIILQRLLVSKGAQDSAPESHSPNLDASGLRASEVLYSGLDPIHPHIPAATMQADGVRDTHMDLISDSVDVARVHVRPRALNQWANQMRLTCTEYSEYPVTVVAWSYLFGGLFMTLCCGMYIPLGLTDRFHLADNIWIPLLYAVFIASTLCYALISWTHQYLQPSLVTAAWPLQIPFVVIMSYIFFGDELMALDWVGAGLIVSGLIAVTWSDYTSHTESKPKLRTRSADKIYEEVPDR
ncbi:hypothetical protein SARC_08912 [Sphaeroforma arctica JP610]|uniref:EamA domain-containing protein n=1 Tax=Sphaeroforma arctica JP610 TaxID=667725 RepID=A0A0L0FPM8_9EUKA|nr:hypothetical protein SARC_08912 [Sphaeroforma arctica JP610]KNC78664.1 hypothetical protein SARC_08912 [Sphaeroforma arctica JP610]|eukprot:XP_014152566.1 hypothetical protein SARC_08912 [Sphaeroforma arctica JP610]